MKSIQKFIESSRPELPREDFARWASIFFSLSVASYLLSIAASQAFLAAAGLTYAVGWVCRRDPINFPPLGWPLAIFCLWTILSTFGSANPAVGWFAVRKLVLFLILILAPSLIVSRKHLVWLYQTLFVEAAAAGLLGVCQFVVQYKVVHAEHPQRTYNFMTLSRITGFMGHWMNFGGQQMLVIAMFGAFLVLRPQVRRLWWLIAAMAAISIILNFTRGVWLGCFVAGLYLMARWKPKLLWAVPLILLAGYLFSPRLVRERVQSVLHPERDPSIAMRFEMWGVGLRMIRRHPWLGVGPNNIPEVYDLYLPPGKSPARGYHGHLHSDFVQFAAERGLPCLLAWIWLMAAIGWHSIKIRRTSSAERWLVDGAIAGWLALLTEGFFEFNFGTSPVLMLYLFVAAAPFILQQINRTQDATSPSAPM